MSTTDPYLPKHLTQTEQQSVLEFVAMLQTHFGRDLLAVVIFGSRARGQADSTSDMDLMIILTEVDADIRETVRHLAAEVWLENEIFLSTRVWGLDHWQRLKELQTGLYQNICQEGIILLSRLDEAILA